MAAANAALTGEEGHISGDIDYPNRLRSRREDRQGRRTYRLDATRNRGTLREGVRSSANAVTLPFVIRSAIIRLRAMGIRDKPITAASPWQNSFAERLIGTIRRECTHHVIALGEQHLRQVVKSYARYYNTSRTHRALAKDAPVSRSVQRIGRVVSHAMVGGLHHQYVRI
jgi:Integrase core domain